MEIIGYSSTVWAMHWALAMAIIWATSASLYRFHLTTDNKLTHLTPFFTFLLATLFIPVVVFSLIRNYGKKIGVQHFVWSATPEYSTSTFFHRLIYDCIAVVLITGVMTIKRPIDIVGRLFFHSLPVIWHKVHQYK